MKAAQNVEMLIKDLVLDHEVNQRVSLNEVTIEAYTEDIVNGDTFPPVSAFKDADEIVWLADGFHRVRAYKAAKVKDIRVNLFKGSKADAIRHAAGANKTHGLRRNSADLEKAIRSILLMDEFRGKSATIIAEVCKCSRQYVNRIKSRLKEQGDDFSDTVTDKNGRQLKTKKIAENAKKAHAKKVSENSDAIPPAEEQEAQVDDLERVRDMESEQLDSQDKQGMDSTDESEGKDQPQVTESYSSGKKNSKDGDGNKKPKPERRNWKNIARQYSYELHEARNLIIALEGENRVLRTARNDALEENEMLQAEYASLIAQYKELEDQYEAMKQEAQVDVTTLIESTSPETYLLPEHTGPQA